MDTAARTNFHWSCKHTWKRSAKNTAWCLLGCSIGDFGTILFFQLTKIPFPVLGIMTLSIINGLITSIILETVILMRQNFDFRKAFNTAIGMSFISMISMEVAMNLTDYLLIGRVNIHGKEVQKILHGVYLDALLVILEQSYFFN